MPAARHLYLARHANADPTTGDLTTGDLTDAGPPDSATV